MKRVAVRGAVLLAVLSLTGCSLLFHRDDVAEKPLRDRIGDLGNVVEVTSSVDNTFGATIWVLVDDLVESDLQEIVASADELLAGRDVTIKIAFDDHNLLTIVYPLESSADVLADEVHYWLALSEANGAPLGILLQQGRDGLYRNIWDPDESDDVDWEALRAVPGTATTDVSYYLDDIVSDTAMPTHEVLDLRDSLAAIELREEESLELEKFAPGYIQVRYNAPGAGDSDPTALPSWPRVVEAVSQVAALRMPQSNFVFQGTGSWAPATALHLGECAVIADGSAEEDSADAELVAALTGSGIEFPLGVGSGFCNEPEGLTADGHIADS